MLVKGPAPEWIGEIVEEAVAGLPYFHRDAGPYLTDLFQSIWPGSVSARMLDSHNLHSLMTDAGRVDSKGAARSLALRVIFNVQRRRQIATEPQWSAYCDKVRLAGKTDFTCEAAEAMMGKILPRERRFALPLLDCGKDWCSCRWDQTS